MLKGVCYNGSWIESLETKYASFQGIPYAQPPIGSLRFKPPQTFKPEETSYDVSATSYVKCPQIVMGITIGQEDCLLLNVYVPEKAFNEDIKLPVMVWIYGGSLITGSNTFNDYGPEQFMKKDVLLVTINYRLGPLGFLSLGNEDVPGNAGLRDQSLALKWVNENIVNFGGDPGSITIFGESAGSLSVALHLISPISEGLFHRAILQSGTAISSNWGPITKQHALQYANKFANELGCVDVLKEDLLSCLQNKHLTDITSLTNLMDGYLYGGYLVWMAVPDIDFCSDPFIPGDPEELLASGQFNTNVEVIIGTNSDEGILDLIEYLPKVLIPGKWDKLREKFETDGPGYLFNIANKSEIMDDDMDKMNKIVEYYIGSIDNINEEHMQGMFNMFTDAGYLHGTYKTIKHLLKQNMTVYQYILTYEGLYSLTLMSGILPKGVCHADDCIYLWDPVFGINLPLLAADKAVRDLMVSAWTNFATYGDPTPPNSGLSWTPLKSISDFQYWNISGPNPIMSSSEEILSRMNIWNEVIGDLPKNVRATKNHNL